MCVIFAFLLGGRHMELKGYICISQSIELGDFLLMGACRDGIIGGGVRV